MIITALMGIGKTMETISGERLAEMLGVLKHGKWLKRNNENYSPFDPCSSENICICNQCGYETDLETNYCPNCGAKMDGERREEE